MQAGDEFNHDGRVGVIFAYRPRVSDGTSAVR